MPITIYGKNPVYEALNAKRKIHEIFLTEHHTPDYIDLIKAQNIKTTILPKGKMNALVEDLHQNIIATVEDYQYKDLKTSLKEPGEKLYLMLDSIEDPHNLGAIMRSAEAFNITGIIIPKNRSVSINSTVVKVSTGAIEYIDVIQVNNLNQTIKTLKEHNVWIVGTDLETDNNLDAIHSDTDLCVVLGSEGKGLSRLVKENCDYLVKIPMQGHANSLNVSVSAGIIVYDIIRRRG